MSADDENDPPRNVRQRQRPASLDAPALSDPTYKVGYKHPPIETQFQRGKSGNPSGRPRGSRKSLDAAIARQLDRRTPVKIGARTIQMSLRDVIARRLAEDAAKGNIKAVTLMLRMDSTRQAAKAPEADAEIWDKSDDDLLARYVADALSAAATPEQIPTPLDDEENEP